MKKIVYMMHVDWNWIKQRPHFIAEGLAEKHNLTVLYQHRYSRSGFQKRDSGGLRLCPIYVIPRGDRSPFFRSINCKIKDLAVRRQVSKTKADCLYLTFPDQVGSIPDNYSGKVIYDCMDNYAAFLNDVTERRQIQEQEAALVNRADAILVSSEKLKSVLLERYGAQHTEKITLVRNGYNGQTMQTVPPTENSSKKYIVAYFGTISSWFNFDFIQKSLEDFPNLEYLLMGPADVPVPQHQRINYIGTVEHKELPVVTKAADCLAMPFVVNELIEAVDPVKLYEYINFNKNILCVKYPEVERFDPFVYFYTDYETYKQQLTALMEADHVKYTDAQRKSFLSENSWVSRVQIIEKLL